MDASKEVVYSPGGLFQNKLITLLICLSSLEDPAAKTNRATSSIIQITQAWLLVFPLELWETS